jgi:hypothetical protein
MTHEVFFAEERQMLGQLEPQRGGYFYLVVARALVENLPAGRKTRLICDIDGRKKLRCGLSPLGNGDHFILISTANAKELGIGKGSPVTFRLAVDPGQLGVEMPPALAELLRQEDDLKAAFDELTDGKKRSLIFQLLRIRDIDRQVMKAVALLSGDERIGPPSSRKR